MIFENVKLPLLYAHRGCRTLAPENTMSAFRKAVELKVPAIEFDIQMCKSGELVVTHDFDTKRISGKKYKIRKTDYSVLKELDFGSFFSPEFSDEKIPLLKDVFEQLGENLYFDVEIKREYGLPTKEIVTKVINLIEEYGLSEKCLISSFNPFIVRRAIKLGFKRTSIIFSTDDKPPIFLRRGLGYLIAKSNIIKPKISTIQKSKISKFLLKKNIDKMTWTVDTDEQFKAAMAANCEGICSNIAEKFISNIDNN